MTLSPAATDQALPSTSSATETTPGTGVRPWVAAICGRPGDGSELLVDWLSLGCREQGLLVDARPLHDAAPDCHGYRLQVAPFSNEPLAAVPVAADLLVAGDHMELVRALGSGLIDADHTAVVTSSSRKIEAVEFARSSAAALSEREIDALLQHHARHYVSAHGYEVLGWHSLPPRAQPGLLFGMLCSSRSIGLTPDECRGAIAALGVDVAAQMRAFEIGLRHGRAAGGRVRRTLTAQQFVRKRRSTLARKDRSNFERLIERIDHEFDLEHRTDVREAAYAVARYESCAYAAQVVDACASVASRERVQGVEPEQSVLPVFAAGCVRLLAYADPAHVARVLSARGRGAQVRQRHGIGRRELYEIIDQFHLNGCELAELVPQWLARRFDSSGSPLFARTRRLRRSPMTIRGALRLRLTASLGRRRAHSERRRVEMACFDQYVATVCDALAVDVGLAALVARSATLVGGVGAVRAASRVTAESFWGGAVRQSLAIDARLPEDQRDAFAARVIPAVFNRLLIEGAIALWDDLARITDCALYQARGGSHSEIVAVAHQIARMNPDET